MKEAVTRNAVPQSQDEAGLSIKKSSLALGW